MGWGSSPKPPPAPDYKGAAEATSASNQQAQTSADWANRPTVNTPWGQESWSTQAVMDPATGKMVNKWTQTQTLNPQQQAALDSQQAVDMGRSQLAQAQMGRAGEALANPFDWDHLQGYGQVNQQNIDPSQYMSSGAGQGMQNRLDPSLFGDAGRQRFEQMAFDRMAPQHQQAQASLESQLAGMGLTRGSQDWNHEMQRLQDQQSRERYDAYSAGGQEQQNQYALALGQGQFQNAAQQQGWQQGMGQNAQNYGLMAGANQQNFSQGLQAANYQNALRQQQIGEQQLKRQMPLNEMNALLTGQQVGQLQTPDFAKSASAGGTDYSGAANSQYGAAMDAYNAKAADKQSMMSGVAGVAGVGLMVF